jgi:hypothetical protein
MCFALEQAPALRFDLRRPGVMGTWCLAKRNKIDSIRRDGIHVQQHLPRTAGFTLPH